MAFVFVTNFMLQMLQMLQYVTTMLHIMLHYKLLIVN